MSIVEPTGPAQRAAAQPQDAALEASCVGDAGSAPVSGGFRLVVRSRDAAAELRLADVAGSVPLAIWIADPELTRMLYVSPGFEAIFGRAACELLQGRAALIDAIHPEDRDAALAAAAQLPEVPSDVLYRVVRPDGSARWVRDRAVPVRDAAGRPVQIVGFCLDVTSEQETQRALATSEERYRSIVESATDGIWLVDGAWRTTFVNAAMARMLGTTAAELQGSLVRDAVEAADLPLAAEIASRVELGLPGRDDLAFRKRDGGLLRASVASQPLLDAAGRFLGALAVVTDVGERRRAEEALRRHAERLEILGQIDAAVLGATTVEEIARRSLPKARLLTGADGILLSILDPDRTAAVLVASDPPAGPGPGAPGTAVSLASLGAFPYASRAEIVFSAGPPAEWSWSPASVLIEPETPGSFASVPLGGGDGALLGRLGAVWRREGQAGAEDLEILRELGALLSVALEQARMRQEIEARAAELARTNELLRAVMEGTSDAVFVKDREGRFLYVNPAFTALVGFPAAELLGRTHAVFAGPEYAAAMEAEDRQVLEAGAPFTFERAVAPHLSDRTVQTTKGPYRDGAGKVVGVVGIARDVSERRRAELERRRNEERLAFTLELSEKAPSLSEKELFDLGLEKAVALTGSRIGYLHLVDEDQRNLRLVTWSREALLGCTAPFDSHYPLEAAGVWADSARLRRPVVHNDYRGLPGRKGYPQGHTDVVRHASVPVLDGDKVILVLGVGNKETDYDEADVRRLREIAGDVLRVAMRRRAEEELRRHAGRLELLHEIDTAVLHAVGPDEITARARARLAALGYAGGEPPAGMQGPLREVSDRLALAVEQARLREQLRHAQKMEAIGRLAGGVAHDFNNLLTAVRGHATLLEEAVPPGAPGRRHLDEIVGTAATASTLTRQLLAISRRQPLEPRVVDARDAVTQLQPDLDRLVGAGIALETRLDERPCPVRVDPGQLTQVLLNLAVNARDAMPDGGTLRVDVGRTDSVSPGGGPLVRLAVSDTGTGMDSETLARAFEPFFTTKQRKDGSGLGLSIVHGVVEQSGGTTRVSSAPGKGSTFEVFLPRLEPPAPLAVPVPPPPAEPAAPSVVLLVEDTDAVREVLAESLEEAGFQVIASGTAEDALQKVAAGARLDLLLTDVLLPGLSGAELARHVTALRPGARVVFMSGYAAVDEEEPLPGLLLLKPFTPAELLATLRGALAFSAPPA